MYLSRNPIFFVADIVNSVLQICKKKAFFDEMTSFLLINCNCNWSGRSSCCCCCCCYDDDYDDNDANYCACRILGRREMNKETKRQRRRRRRRRRVKGIREEIEAERSNKNDKKREGKGE